MPQLTLNRGEKKPTVILAEDDPQFSDRIVTLLQENFDIIGVVADGTSLIQLVDQMRPDAVVSDIGLPDINGIKATIKIRKQSDVPIVLITAFTDDFLRSAALASGASAFVSKTDVAVLLVPLLLDLLHF